MNTLRNMPSIFFLGEFADVYKGTLQTSKGKQIVAVKVLRVCIYVGPIFLDFCLLQYKQLYVKLARYMV